MAPTYKVTYFDITGLGEPIRYLLSYGDFDFEDNRVNIKDWPSLKSSTPFGCLPTLEYNGKIAHQSMAICRYVAKKCKLTGKDDWDDLKIDAAVNTVGDLRNKFAEFYYEPDEKLSEDRRKIVFEDVLPFYMDRLENQAKENNGFLAVPYLTWADVVFAAILEYLNFMSNTDLAKNYPTLKGIRTRVVDLPNIKKWLERRPKETPLNPKYFES